MQSWDLSYQCRDSWRALARRLAPSQICSTEGAANESRMLCCVGREGWKGDPRAAALFPIHLRYQGEQRAVLRHFPAVHGGHGVGKTGADVVRGYEGQLILGRHHGWEFSRPPPRETNDFCGHTSFRNGMTCDVFRSAPLPAAHARAGRLRGRRAAPELTAAAAELNLTQSAVSRQIRQLEDLLGSELFARERRAVRLTTVGEAMRRKSAPRYSASRRQRWASGTTRGAAR